MPKSPKRKRPTRSISNARRASGRPPAYRPSLLPDDPESFYETIRRLPPDRLTDLGLALWYLQMTPNRQANQCLEASLSLEMAMTALGLEAMTMALQIDVPWAAGGRGLRYGSPDPHFEGKHFVGHAGVFTGERLIDVTAAQFPELRSIVGVRPVVLPIPAAGGGRVVDHGLEALVGLGVDKKMVRYEILPAIALADVTQTMLDTQSEALQVRALNLLTTYTAVLAGILEEDVVAEVGRSCPRLATWVGQARGKRVEYVDGRAQLVPNA